MKYRIIKTAIEHTTSLYRSPILRSALCHGAWMLCQPVIALVTGFLWKDHLGRLNRQIHIFVLIVISFATYAATASDGRGVQAEIISGENATPRGQLLISETQYLFKTEKQEELLSLLVDIESGQTTLINHKKETFCSMPSLSRESLELDPIEVFRFVSGFYTSLPDDREILNGLDCSKTRYLSHGQHLITAWFFEDISIPVKVVNHRFPEMNYELQKIRREEIRPEDLTMPEGYQEIRYVSDPALAATEWTVTAGASETIMLEEDKAFELAVTDDLSDGVSTRGRMILLRNAPSPIDRVEAPLKLSNGQSIKLAYPASVQIKAIEFHISKGGIHIKRVKPE